MINRSNVISGGTSNQHVVEGYRFKVISEFDNHVVEHHLQNSNEENDKRTHEDVVQENQSIVSTQTIQESQIQTFQPNFVEDLLKKTDEMSSNIIKLQMQIESQENEFNNRLNSELENAKEKFTKEGFDKAKEEFQKELDELKDKYLKSIAKLDDACANLEIFIEKNEKELAQTAIDIAKEVILKELELDSQKIAYALAKDLISELKGASAIELKINAQDYEYLKEQFSQDTHIKVSLDDAISKGSVVIISDAGNIESNLNSRLMKIKKMVNNE
ncbi:flagellar assembly protein FliH [Campylobacter hepaticus]|uniref:Flagellar assembly protein FliH n=1 Tax=Campylobacter hepaticus TaxID=1813019 RepID=A0A424Z317_9BACT|nr:flagellar assembly protein FliH [Campylobacter hepaticus]MDX2331008.1 flagellar assembly protein FliH [Campylobacter hepaticus]MDX2371667.1 flagellar assembly protein FliH [Campylobacter hepaticus]MDX2396873.1 flagellar assembly protein FliH [Campylobacter hepaticus]MDX5508825.1 flagellar assembly protein FliH [Campylobacter hepaticus]RQD68758.1 flagellar assembly protein FliH [Campylobacter hepaticus]